MEESGKNSNIVIAEISKEKCYYRQTSKPQTRLENMGRVPLLRFTCMEQFDWLSLGFTTKLGGVSEGYLAELNLGWKQGDDRENVCKNYQLACESLPGDYKKLVLSDQIHCDKVIRVTEKHTSGDNFEQKLVGTDGMVTNEAGLILATSYADCMPLFFVDPVHHAIGSSHSGWRGTVKNIGAKTIAKMAVEFGSRPEDLTCLIGPSICQECYEVGEDVVNEFRKVFAASEWKDIYAASPKERGKYQLDLWGAAWHQLRRAGVAADNIFVAGVCTSCNSELLFSHRRTNGKRGNLNGLMTILK